ncbi:MAG: DMT family transporter [Firmicutes bacterium]|nr:DMT family transporter [Bacillota bacterium]
MAKRNFAGELALLTTALIWGSGFIGVDYCLEAGFPPSMINMLRFLIGAAAMLLIINKKIVTFTKAEIKTGAIAGFFFFLGFHFQAIGMQTIEVSSNALLTATNLLMVPFICRLVFKEKIAIRVYIAVFACFFGIAVLNWSESGFTLRMGDILTLICAFGFACHIAYLGYAGGGNKNTMNLTFMQLFTVGVLSSVYFFCFETSPVAVSNWGIGIAAVMYLALFPTALCMFLQTFGQKRTATSKSAILLSLESLFGAAFSVLLGLEPVTINLLIGGGIIFLSVLWLEWRNSKQLSKGELIP